ncbi:hypothetical protein BU17DRAFT_27070, partial [Hysterangium stoloniferum]
SSPRKRKHRDEGSVGPSTKKHKKEKRSKESSEFILLHASLAVAIPPVFASNPAQGVEEMLDSMIMRYIPTLRGVVLTHSNLRFLQSKARIQDDCPYAICNVGFDAMVWSPRVGHKLTGKVILCSPDHVSLLVDRTFNVSIPRHHIPRAEWIFEWGPAENDPEYGAAAAGAEGATTLGSAVADKSADEPENLGRWVHAVTGEQLGPTLDFIVIGLTVANQMLSLIGSIQPDPFSPEHVPPAQEQSKHNEEDDDEEAEEEEAEDLQALEDGEAESSDPELDTFAELGKKADKMAAEEAKKAGKAKKRKEVEEKEKEKGEREKAKTNKKQVKAKDKA